MVQTVEDHSVRERTLQLIGWVSRLGRVCALDGDHGMSPFNGSTSGLINQILTSPVKE